ncbi:MAG: DNA-protecting protein DprA [Chloroflexi bacterium]|nr:DNA-protecting protein DprA [Chloroflexota bacterium]
MSEERRYWLGFSRVPGIGVQRANDLRRAFGSLEAAWGANERELATVRLPEFVLKNLMGFRHKINLDGEMRRLDALGVRLATLDDSDYPYLLRNITNPPMVLYVRGSLTAADQRSLAMVGTRKATRLGKDTARKFGTELAQQGVTIVSGLAQGIDYEAHTGALEGHGRTIAVLGSGIDVIYPRQHARLAETICQNGALVSEFAPGTPPEGANFPRRNRIISGLSQGVLVVEAPLRSGALITATAAGEQGREVFAIPASLSNPFGFGCNRLIQDGAKLVMDVADILNEMLPITERQQMREVAEQISADSPIEAQILGYLRGDPVHIDEIARMSSLPVSEVLGVLTLLELKGLAQCVAPMQYCGTI